MSKYAILLALFLAVWCAAAGKAQTTSPQASAESSVAPADFLFFFSQLNAPQGVLSSWDELSKSSLPVEVKQIYETALSFRR